MSYKRITDLHVHTDNSFDGHHSAMFMCEQATAKGLRAVAFTDHMDIDLYDEHRLDVRQLHSYFEVSKARSAFQGKLLVLIGIELGQGIYDMPLAEETLSRFKYDFVIGSIHNNEGMADFSLLDYPQMSDGDIYSLLETYYDTLYRHAAWGHFDSMAHLTYPLRYINGEQKRGIDVSRFDDKADEIFRMLIAKGKALEINTSGLRQPLGETMPGERYVRRFRELGGEFVTIGSDAHYAEHLGAGIGDGMAMAKRCGFDYVTFFADREPMPLLIEE